MAVRVRNIKISVLDDISNVKKNASKITGVKEKDIKNFKIIKESIDARKKNNIDLIYTVDFECDNEEKIAARCENGNVSIEKSDDKNDFVFGDKKLEERPVIIGSGPAGMFAGITLAKMGYCPLILERGSSVDERTAKVENFFKTGMLDENSNIQFGEGGAGTFSDGKLTTRIKDKRCSIVLNEFVKAGAPAEIIYSGKPHIGTDILKNVVKNLRGEIIKNNGEVRFDSKVTDIKIVNGKIKSVRVNDEYDIPCSIAVLATGHSARDTSLMLLNRGAEISPKPFAIGVRIEHLQRMIDECQYGKFAGNPKLGAADYRLTYVSKKTGRPCYTFCMCPGGFVVAAASENKRVVTNGMSQYKRDGINANSAVVVGVNPEDFGSSNPLSGIEFQRHYEETAYICGGGDYMAPVQLVGDFLNDKISKNIGKVKPSYSRGYNFASLKMCLPKYVVDTLKEGIISFDRKIKGFSDYDSLMTGIETRTSSPIRYERNENLEAKGIAGLYPCGEGAGYAGGIISAAVDGVKIAEKIASNYAPIA